MVIYNFFLLSSISVSIRIRLILILIRLRIMENTNSFLESNVNALIKNSYSELIIYV